MHFLVCYTQVKERREVKMDFGRKIKINYYNSLVFFYMGERRAPSKSREIAPVHGIHFARVQALQASVTTSWGMLSPRYRPISEQTVIILERLLTIFILSLNQTVSNQYHKPIIGHSTLYTFLTL